MTIEADATADDIPVLRETLLAGRSPRDRIEHVYVEVDVGMVRVVLYLLSTDLATAQECATQLTRRALAQWSSGRAWLLRHCDAKEIGGAVDPP